MTEARVLITSIRTAGRLDFDQPVGDPRLRVAGLDSPGAGQMIGVLVARGPGQENTGAVILKAFSGELLGVPRIEGWVPPLSGLSYGERKEAEVEIGTWVQRSRVAEARLQSPGLDRDEIRTLRRELAVTKRTRQDLSRALMERIHREARVVTGAGRIRPLTEVFGLPGIPGGTGTCCAPKLLSEANRRGLEPLEVAEVWIGAPPKGRPRQEGQVYPACSDKCRPLLGGILCPR